VAAHLDAEREIALAEEPVRGDAEVTKTSYGTHSCGSTRAASTARVLAGTSSRRRRTPSSPWRSRTKRRRAVMEAPLTFDMRIRGGARYRISARRGHRQAKQLCGQVPFMGVAQCGPGTVTGPPLSSQQSWSVSQHSVPQQSVDDPQAPPSWPQGGASQWPMWQ
jgi:hypothetical protein